MVKQNSFYILTELLNLYTDPLAEVAALRRSIHHFHPKREIEFPKMIPPLFYRKKPKLAEILLRMHHAIKTKR